MTPDIATTAAAHRRGLRLEWLTIWWNVGEVGVTVVLGVLARSLALIAFGVDALIEVFASLVVVWHLKTGGSSPTRARTQRALRLVAASFAMLAVALVVAAVGVLAAEHQPEESWPGVIYLAVTAVVMFTLAIRKRSTARILGSAPLASEATITFLDGLLASGILAALALNIALGWWCADPVATLLVAAVAVHQAWETWREAEED